MKLIKRYIGMVLCLVLLIAGCLNLRIVRTDGNSMLPTYKPGNILLCVRAWSAPEVGDVVLIRHQGQLIVKRVAPYPQDAPYGPLPEDRIYVLGDNPEESYDSRSPGFGLVPIGEIWGYVLLKL